MFEVIFGNFIWGFGYICNRYLTHFQIQFHFHFSSMSFQLVTLGLALGLQMTDKYYYRAILGNYAISFSNLP